MSDSTNTQDKQQSFMDSLRQMLDATSKPTRISAAIVALILLIFFGMEILRIAFVGGAAFVIIYLVVKYHKQFLNTKDK